MPGSASVAGRDGIGPLHVAHCGPIGIRNSCASCHQGRHQHPLDKEHTLFLVQLRLAVLGLDLVRKEQCACICTKITPILLLSETAKRDDGFLNIVRMEKNSNCPSFWKFVCHQSSSVVLESSCWKFESHQTSSVMLEANSTRCVDSKIKQRCYLSWILDRTRARLCITNTLVIGFAEGLIPTSFGSDVARDHWAQRS